MSEYRVRLLNDGEEIDIEGYSELVTDACELLVQDVVTNGRQISFGPYDEGYTVGSFGVITPDGTRYRDTLDSSVHITAGTTLRFEEGDMVAERVEPDADEQVPVKPFRELAEQWREDAIELSGTGDGRNLPKCADDLQNVIEEHT